MLKILNLKLLSKIVADDILFYYYYFSGEISLCVSYESSARQTIHMKCKVLFSLKKKKKKKKKKKNGKNNVVCCSCDWRLKELRYPFNLKLCQNTITTYFHFD